MPYIKQPTPIHPLQNQETCLTCNLLKSSRVAYSVGRKPGEESLISLEGSIHRSEEDVQKQRLILWGAECLLEDAFRIRPPNGTAALSADNMFSGF